MTLNGKINKTIKTKEEIKKHQIEIGAVADGIVGFETIQKNIERFKGKMTREEAINNLEDLWNEVYNEDSDGYIYAEALDMAIEALKAEPSTEGRYEKAIKTLQEMPKYINSNTIGKKLEVFNYTKGGVK